ncbi:MAG: hypothetical protein COA79_12630 [Planctomycetota bacterium]|nr:MAG: hypothetical protein COA79_12630 [Planctomycetota bacterium]
MSVKSGTTFEIEIYKKYYNLVYSTCMRCLYNKDLIDDAAQSTFLLFIKREEKIKNDLSTWFYWASRNICIVINRKEKKHFILDVELVENEEYQDDICLGKLIDSLPKKKRELLLMRFYDNLSYQEISERTNSKEVNIRKIIERTITLLQSKFKKKDVLVTTLLSQFFYYNKASAATLNPNIFILQNSLIQQSIVKGVVNMYLISKLKIAVLCMMISLMPVGLVLYADGNKKEIVTNEPIIDGGHLSNNLLEKKRIKLIKDFFFTVFSKDSEISNAVEYCHFPINWNGILTTKSKFNLDLKAIENNKKQKESMENFINYEDRFSGIEKYTAINFYKRLIKLGKLKSEEVSLKEYTKKYFLKEKMISTLKAKGVKDFEIYKIWLKDKFEKQYLTKGEEFSGLYYVFISKNKDPKILGMTIRPRLMFR